MIDSNKFLFHQDRTSCLRMVPRHLFVFQNPEQGKEQEQKTPDQKKTDVSQLGYSFALNDARRAVQPYTEVSIVNANINMAASQAMHDLDALDRKDVDTLDPATKEANLKRMRAIMERFTEYPKVQEKMGQVKEKKDRAVADAKKKGEDAFQAILDTYSEAKGFKLSPELKAKLDQMKIDTGDNTENLISFAVAGFDASITNMSGEQLRQQGTKLDGFLKLLDGSDASLQKDLDTEIQKSKVTAEGYIAMEIAQNGSLEDSKKFVNTQIDAAIDQLPKKDELDKDRSANVKAKYEQLRGQILASLDGAGKPEDAMKRFSVLAYFKDQLNLMALPANTPDEQKPPKTQDAFLQASSADLAGQKAALDVARQESGTAGQILANARERNKDNPNYKDDPKLVKAANEAYLAFTVQNKKVQGMEANKKQYDQMPKEPPLAKSPDLMIAASTDSVSSAMTAKLPLPGEGPGQKATLTIDGVPVTFDVQFNSTRGTYFYSVFAADNPNLGSEDISANVPVDVAEKVAKAVRDKKEKDRKTLPGPSGIAAN